MFINKTDDIFSCFIKFEIFFYNKSRLNRKKKKKKKK